MPSHLRPATRADLPAVAELSALAFDPHTDAIASCIFPAHLQPEGKLDYRGQIPWRLARKVVTLENRNAEMVVIEEYPEGDGEKQGVLVGFAALKKHKEFDWTEPPVPTPPNGDEEARAQLIKHLTESNDALFGKQALESMWYLSLLAVHPDHQRKGLGKTLLNWAVGRAREARREMYIVATPVGISLYRAAGFEDVGVVDINNVPHYQMMLRNPPKAGTEQSGA